MGEVFICPCCNRVVKLEHFSCKAGEKGGMNGKGKSKARSSEVARAAALKRWENRRRRGKIV